MEQLNDNKIICHIVGLNPNDKSKIKEVCNNIPKYHLIDLDNINNEILNNDTMNKLFKNNLKLKKNKNDKFKDIDKKKSKKFKKIKNSKCDHLISMNDGITLSKYNSLQMNIINISNPSKSHSLEVNLNNNSTIYHDSFIYLEITSELGLLKCFYNLEVN